MKRSLHMSTPRLSYYRRVMGALVAVLLLTIAVVQWWPPPNAQSPPGLFRDRPSERIPIRDIQPTRQSRERTPPPPAPLPPLVVPNDELVEQELEMGDADLRVETAGDDAQLQEGTDRATAGRRPDRDARLLRNVQPNYPSAAREEGVRARIEVEITITENGRVTDARVRRRWLLSESTPSQPVSDLGYGLEAAALSAARRTLFRPARANGKRVSTRKVITFTFGPQ
jgi:outer membrane biosynthesis protein TonB